MGRVKIKQEKKAKRAVTVDGKDYKESSSSNEDLLTAAANVKPIKAKTRHDQLRMMCALHLEAPMVEQCGRSKYLAIKAAERARGGPSQPNRQQPSAGPPRAGSQ